MLSMTFCILGISTAILMELQLIAFNIGRYFDVLNLDEKTVLCHVAIDTVLLVICLVLGIVISSKKERNPFAQSVSRIAKKVAIPICVIQFLLFVCYEESLHSYDPDIRGTEISNILFYSAFATLLICLCIVFTEFFLCPDNGKKR